MVFRIDKPPPILSLFRCFTQVLQVNARRVSSHRPKQCPSKSLSTYNSP